MKFHTSESYAWTDSTIVLSWLRGHPAKWKTFVANRIVEIHESLEPDRWKHVASSDNPADCASRGIYPIELKTHKLWWTGPSWLRGPEIEWPSTPLIPHTTLDEKKMVSLLATRSETTATILVNCSSYTKLIRSTAYVFRFINNIKSKNSKQIGYLKSTELQLALTHWIIISQAAEFASEIQNLKTAANLSSKSKLMNLNPFIDEADVLRVGGRLKHSHLRFESKHPIILPNHNRLTDLIIDNLHFATQHGGPQIILSLLQRKFWVLNARNTVRLRLFKCVTCHRHRNSSISQLMGQLPQPRVIPLRAFQHTGVDYAGPLNIKTNKKRQSSTYKAYIAVFVCMSVKAVHLELVTELTTEGFLVAFRRFTARRGHCTKMYSDCGTNFIGAARRLSEDLIRSSLDTQLAELLANDGTDWQFNA